MKLDGGSCLRKGRPRENRTKNDFGEYWTAGTGG